MIIETKFNIGDTVWVMHNNKPTRCTILKPNFYNEKDLSCVVGWRTDIQESGWGVTINVPFNERDMFETKEELLSSL